MNNKSISDTVNANFRAKVGKWGRRMAAIGLLAGLTASLYATLPRDKNFYFIPFVTAPKSNTASGRYIVPLDKRVPLEDQQKAAGAATCAMILMVSGFAMQLYSTREQYNGNVNQR